MDLDAKKIAVEGYVKSEVRQKEIEEARRFTGFGYLYLLIALWSLLLHLWAYFQRDTSYTIGRIMQFHILFGILPILALWRSRKIGITRANSLGWWLGWGYLIATSVVLAYHFF